MRHPLSRRLFLQKVAVSGAAVVGFDARTRSWILAGQVRSQPFDEVPKLDGSLVYDDKACLDAASDHGNFLHRKPTAVLKPGSAQDIVTMVRYANSQNLKIAMRGQGHSRSGETLVESGIVIDSRSLNSVRLVGAESVDAEPGALSGDVYKAGLARDLTLPVMPLCTELSVGGVLSAGGWGPASHHFGAAVDNVQELDVVTGDGRTITCSALQERELFDMVLAGLGQCALILRARLRLVPAPSRVVRQSLLYQDLTTFLADQELLTLERRFDHQSGRAVKAADGGWSFQIETWKFHGGQEESDPASLHKGLHFSSTSEPVPLSYWDYIGPEAAAKGAAWTTARATRRLGDMVMFVPGSAGRSFTEKILKTLSASSFGPPSFTCVPLNARRFSRPLFKLPSEAMALSIWLFPRSVPASDSGGYVTLIRETRAIFESMQSLGGKCYIPHSTVSFSHDDWKNHFGPETWLRLSAAKRQYDPNNVLTPGPGMFGSPQ